MSTAAPGGMNERIFTCVIREGAGFVPVRQCVASAATPIARPICASSRSVAGKTGRRGKWSPKKGADSGTNSVALARDARDAGRAHDARRLDAAETARRRAGAADELEARRELGGRIELLDRQHRTEAVDELDHVRTVDAGAPGIGDRVLVAALDVDGEIERAAGRDRRSEARLVGERRDGPAAKADVRHRDPRRELSRRPRRRGRAGTRAMSAGTA